MAISVYQIAVDEGGLCVQGPGVNGVEVEEHAHEEEQQEGDTVEDEDVRDVRNVRGGQQGHLLFCCAHEEEA